MKILIEINTDTNKPFYLDTNGLADWLEDQVNSQIGSMNDEKIKYAYPTVKILENE